MKQFLIQINEDPARAVTLEKVQRMQQQQQGWGQL